MAVAKGDSLTELVCTNLTHKACINELGLDLTEGCWSSRSRTAERSRWFRSRVRNPVWNSAA
jgi:hypothetical protein